MTSHRKRARDSGSTIARPARAPAALLLVILVLPVAARDGRAPTRPDAARGRRFVVIGLACDGSASPVAHGGAEAVGLLGYNPSDGVYSGTMGVLMGSVGGASNNARYIYGTEILSSDPHFKPTSAVEASLGPEIPYMGGLEFGGGSFKSCDEVGFNIHGGGSLIGEHGAIGFGFGQRF